MPKRNLLRLGTRAAILGAAVLAASAAFAWSGPPGSPTACPSGYAGCDAPLNVGSTGQTKSGTLYVNAAGNAFTANSTNSGWGGVFYSNGGGAYAQSAGVGFQGANTSGGNWGGYFTGGYGAYGQGSSGYGLYGYSSGNIAVYGQTAANSYGVYGYAPASGAVGVRGDGNAYGVFGYSTSSGCYGISGYNSYSLYGNCNGYFAGSLTASAYYYSSDARLKKDIQPLSDSLASVLALRPVTYEWKDTSRGAGEQLGFIAQDVQAIVPDIVHEDPSTGMLSVDYARVAPLLVGAVQAQQARLDAEQKEIDALKAEVNALKAQR